MHTHVGTNSSSHATDLFTRATCALVYCGRSGSSSTDAAEAEGGGAGRAEEGGAGVEEVLSLAVLSVAVVRMPVSDNSHTK